MQYSIWWLTHKASGGNSLSLKDTAHSHRLHATIASRRRKRRDYHVHKVMDHIYGMCPLSRQQQHVLHISLSNGTWSPVAKLNFDHTTFLIYIWITLWLHQMNFQKRKKNQGQNTFQLNLKVLPPLACLALQFTISLFKVKMKIGAWSICIWTKREKQIMNFQNVISITLPLFLY